MYVTRINPDALKYKDRPTDSCMHYDGDEDDRSISTHLWNGNAIILMLFLSLAAPEVTILTTSDAASHDKFVNETTFPFHDKEISVATF